MSERVRVFFYGSYINRDVLADNGLTPERLEVTHLFGYSLVIRPLANLVRSDRDVVFGVDTYATHAELERLYAHARDVLGGVYLPEAVVTRDASGALHPALTYVAHTLAEAKPDPAYVQRIAGPARALGFPDWYVAHVESFGA